MNNTDLLDHPILPGIDSPVYEKHMTTAERFQVFHAKNPHLFLRLLNDARRAFYRGRKIGIRCLWENVRHDYLMHTTGDGGYKMDNNFTKYYAEAIMEEDTALAGYFNRRERH
ncbi:hypothetical protein OAF54_02955 [bacterium]|nr:hypothetical protein [bacterium]